MYRDRPWANPAPTHTTHALHDGNGFSYSLQLGSHRSGHGETISTPGMRHADVDAKMQTPITVCAYVCVSVCYSTQPPACLPSCRSAAVNLSVCPVCRSQHSLMTIPAGLGDHKNNRRIGTPGLSTTEDGTLQVTALAGSPAFQPAQPDMQHLWTTCTCCTALWPQPSPASVALWMCRLPDRVLWLVLGCCPIVKVNLLHSRLPIMLYVSEGCQAGGCPVVVSQRQQKAVKSIETRSSASGGNSRLPEAHD